MATEPKRPRGRPPADPSGTQTAEKVRLSPAEKDHLRTHYGSVNAGLRTLVRMDMEGRQR